MRQTWKPISWTFWIASSRVATKRRQCVGHIFRRRMARVGRSASPHTPRTALRSNRPLGSAEVVHPFHPLRGQRFVVLKVRSVSGVETLSLRHTDLGSFALPREWTDWGPPGAEASA